MFADASNFIAGERSDAEHGVQTSDCTPSDIVDSKSSSISVVASTSTTDSGPTSFSSGATSSSEPSDIAQSADFPPVCPLRVYFLPQSLEVLVGALILHSMTAISGRNTQ